MKKHNILLLSLLSCMSFGLISCGQVDNNETNNNEEYIPDDEIRFTNFKTVKVEGDTLTYDVEIIDERVDINISSLEVISDGGTARHKLPNFKGTYKLPIELSAFRLEATLRYKDNVGRIFDKIEQSKKYYHVGEHPLIKVNPVFIDEDTSRLELQADFYNEELYEFNFKELKLYSKDTLIRTLENKMVQEVKGLDYKLSYELRCKVEYRTESMNSPKTFSYSYSFSFDLPYVNEEDINVNFKTIDYEPGIIRYSNYSDQLGYNIVKVDCYDLEGNLIDTKTGNSNRFEGLKTNTKYNFTVLFSKKDNNIIRKFVKNYSCETYDFKKEEPYMIYYRKENSILFNVDNNGSSTAYKIKKASLYKGETLIKSYLNQNYGEFSKLTKGTRYKIVIDYEYSYDGLNYYESSFTKYLNTNINKHNHSYAYFNTFYNNKEGFIYKINKVTSEGETLTLKSLETYVHDTDELVASYDVNEGIIPYFEDKFLDLKLTYEVDDGLGNIILETKEIELYIGDKFKEPTYDFKLDEVDDTSIRALNDCYLTLNGNRIYNTSVKDFYYKFTNLEPNTTYKLNKDLTYYDPSSNKLATKHFEEEVTTLPRLNKLSSKYFTYYNDSLYYNLEPQTSYNGKVEVTDIYINTNDNKKFIIEPTKLKGVVNLDKVYKYSIDLYAYYTVTYNGKKYEFVKEDMANHREVIDDLTFEFTSINSNYANGDFYNTKGKSFRRIIQKIELVDDLDNVRTFTSNNFNLELTNLKPQTTYSLRVQYLTKYLPNIGLTDEVKTYQKIFNTKAL